MARSELLPFVETSAEDNVTQRPIFVAEQRKLTPVVLLLLMIVAKLTLPLRSHAAFGLHHLFRLVRTWLMTLVGVEVLQTRARLWTHLIRIVNGMVTCAHSSHTRCLTIPLA